MRLLPALALGLALTGCAPEGLAFRVDDRVQVVQPADRSTVDLPLTIDWEARDLPDGTSYAVFVDTTPVPPGEPLSWVARDDSGCRESDGCPDATYLADRGIHATDQTELVLEQLPRTDRAGDDRERHRATVVLLDAEGRRLGESAFEITFDVDRTTGS